MSNNIESGTTCYVFSGSLNNNNNSYSGTTVIWSCPFPVLNPVQSIQNVKEIEEEEDIEEIIKQFDLRNKEYKRSIDY